MSNIAQLEQTIQLSLFECENANATDFNISLVKKNTSEWGTFKDSLRAPIHSWFTYPAGFSYKAVEHSIKKESFLVGKSIIYDPFMGSGTVAIAALKNKREYIGIELSRKYCDMAEKRIEQFKEEITLWME